MVKKGELSAFIALAPENWGLKKEEVVKAEIEAAQHLVFSEEPIILNDSWVDALRR